MLLAMCCVSQCLELLKSTTIPCTHPFSTVAPSLLSSLFLSALYSFDLVSAADFFFSSLSLFAKLSRLSSVVFFICANATLFSHLLVLMLPSLVFFPTYLLFYIKFRLEYTAQCSYCGINSIHFLSLHPFFCVHFVSFFFLIFFLFFGPFWLYFSALGRR